MQDPAHRIVARAEALGEFGEIRSETRRVPEAGAPVAALDQGVGLGHEGDVGAVGDLTHVAPQESPREGRLAHVRVRDETEDDFPVGDFGHGSGRGGG